ncbi:hypothetical protein FZW96_07925 [Bacillus sp. BGMRC 2118]|nr:hypothetical protein FZW96_07925 [Bacillus sp. BGMRC 2118]
MNKKNVVQRVATIMTVLLLLYTVFIAVDQSYQKELVSAETVKKAAETKQSKEIYTKLKEFGFSDHVITEMSEEEIDLVKDLQVIHTKKERIYKVYPTEGDAKYISKKKYNQQLEALKNSPKMSSDSLVKVTEILHDVGKGKFVTITEHQFDYSPRDMAPLGIVTQLNEFVTITGQSARQIWWDEDKNSHSKLEKISYDATLSSYEQRVLMGYTGSANDTSYVVSWKQPSFLQDIIGRTFYTITVFDTPTKLNIVSAYLQANNPNHSSGLQLDRPHDIQEGPGEEWVY